MKTATALCAAITIDDAEGAPEWLHLLPQDVARTADGRGPYTIADADQLMAASLPAGEKLVLCENHATDLAAPKGLPAPARGWIVELQRRTDGIWGRVDWTPEGRALAAARHYRGVSPVIAHRKDGTVTAILRASLTNTPNLAGLQSLHSEESNMDFRVALLEALGLGGEADDAAILAAIKTMKGGAAPAAVALQAALKPIALAVGVAEDADAAAVLAGVEQLKGGSDNRVTALQSEIAGLTGKLTALTDSQARKDATTFVDDAIRAGRVGLKPVRDDYIAMHMAEPARAEKLVNAMPILRPGRDPVIDPAPEGSNDNPTLLAQKASAYQRKMAAEGVTINIAQAVRAVQEGKAA